MISLVPQRVFQASGQAQAPAASAADSLCLKLKAGSEKEATFWRTHLAELQVGDPP